MRYSRKCDTACRHDWGGVDAPRLVWMQEAGRYVAGIPSMKLGLLKLVSTGWPLGPTAATHHVEMTNLLGDEALGWAKLSREPETRIWLYGKRSIEPGRKMGHVNRLSPLDRAR